MATDASPAADTILLIHGLWMTPRSWERWVERFTGRGYRVLAPAYPGLEAEVEALREDPSPIAAVTVRGTIAHLEGIIRRLDRPPILMGHSYGGALVQLLLDRGLGAAGVAIDSAPTEGVRTLRPSQIRATFPVLKNPANRRRSVGLTPEQFHYAFANTLSAGESAKAYERYHVAAPGSWVWGAILGNVVPGRQATWVDYGNNDRAALLFIAGTKDHLLPPAVQKANVGKYRRSRAVTAYKEFPGRAHYTLGQDGWEHVADYALDWAATSGAVGRSTAGGS